MWSRAGGKEAAALREQHVELNTGSWVLLLLRAVNARASCNDDGQPRVERAEGRARETLLSPPRLQHQRPTKSGKPC